MQDAQSSLRHYLHVLRRQWWLVLLVLAVGLGAATLVTARESPVYKATMKVVVGQGGVVIGKNGSVFQPALTSDVDRFTTTMTNLLQSNVVATTVIRDLGLNRTPQSVLGNLSVTQTTNSSVLEVSFTSTSKREAVQVLADVGTVFTSLVKHRLGGQGLPAGSGATQVPAVTTDVFDPAHLEPGQVSPRPVRNLLFAGGLALILGLILAFARESVDDRIRSRREAQEWFGAPVIGSLPKGIRGRGPAVLADGRRKAALGEALDMLRANVQFTESGLDGGTIVVTSAVPQDGKSTVVASLATTLALAGKDVVCVEADLHRPTLDRYLEVPRLVPGVAEVLAGTASLADALVPVELPTPGSNGAVRVSSNGRRSPAEAGVGRLRLVPAGRPPVRPSTILSRDRVHELMLQLSKEAGYVIIDTPPLLVAADAFPLALGADRIIVVARYRKTTRQQAESVRSTLESLGTTTVSIVLTDTSGAEAYGYGYQYGYASPRKQRVAEGSRRD